MEFQLLLKRFQAPCVSSQSVASGHQNRGVISTFSWGPKTFLFLNVPRLLENWKKLHFICSNLTLFIVPSIRAFISFVFFFSVYYYYFIIISSLYFLFSFVFPWGDGPLKCCPCTKTCFSYRYGQLPKAARPKILVGLQFNLLIWKKLFTKRLTAPYKINKIPKCLRI